MFATAPILSSRSIAGNDSDAQAYINAIQTAGRTLSVPEQSYINTYVVGLKSAGIWAKIYDRGMPIWGTEAPALITLKRVATGTNHGATFNSSGADFDGVATYIDLGIAGNVIGSLNDHHVSVYSADNTTVASNFDVGAFNASNQQIRMSQRAPASATCMMYSTVANGQVAGANNPNPGYLIGTRISSTDLQLYKNGVSIGTTAATSGSVPTVNFYLGCYNNAGSAAGFTNRNNQLWSLGTGLTSTQAGDDYTLTQAFMTSMGIQV